MIFRIAQVFAQFLNQLEYSIRPPLFIFLAAILLLMDCSGRSNRPQPTDYFPIHLGYTWVFNGEIHKMEITDVTKEVGDKIVMFTYSDSLNVPLWQEHYNLVKNQIYLHTYDPMTNLLPVVTFEPALPFAPISRKIGQTLSYECIETQTLDTLVTTTQINVDYRIEAVEDVRVPAGLFLNCIKMKINIKYPQSAIRPYFIGDQYWWFAPRVGPVKYDLPTASGELMEMPNIKNWSSELSKKELPK